jgi:hypothetical protein
MALKVQINLLNSQDWNRIGHQADLGAIWEP